MLDDYFGILTGAKWVVQNTKSVQINKDAVQKCAELIRKQIEHEKLLNEEQFGCTLCKNDIERIQLVFLEDAVNFCFWAGKNEKKWQIKNENGEFLNGWVALVECFSRAMCKKTPILDAKWLSQAEIKDFRDFFMGENDVLIPLFEERVKNLQEAARVLLDKYDGQFENSVLQSEHDALKLVKLVVEDFPSFQDEVNYLGRKVRFYKRAQIIAYDTFLMFDGSNLGKLKNIDILTIFADYKLPQILRELGVLKYSKSLENKIDNLIEIPAGGREEVEIRTATIVVGNELSRVLKIPSVTIDNALWILAQQRKMLHPYHRTRTIYY